jgi:hypothetical protein
MFEFENCFLKSCLNLQADVVRLLWKLNSNQKNINAHIKLLYFSLFQCTNHQLTALADLGQSINPVKPSISTASLMALQSNADLCLQNGLLPVSCVF